MICFSNVTVLSNPRAFDKRLTFRIKSVSVDSFFSFNICVKHRYRIAFKTLFLIWLQLVREVTHSATLIDVFWSPRFVMVYRTVKMALTKANVVGILSSLGHNSSKTSYRIRFSKSFITVRQRVCQWKHGLLDCFVLWPLPAHRMDDSGHGAAWFSVNSAGIVIGRSLIRA